MTDFTVAYRNGYDTYYSGDAAHYELNPQSGVLTVFDGEGKRMHFSMEGWISVTEAAPVSAFDTPPEA
jgi:hypothetical protein